MVRTLLVLRHGKAQPDAPHGDKARTLTERGRRDLARMGRLLAPLDEEIDLVVSSDASRARETAQIAAAAAGYDEGIRIEPDIYNASVDNLLAVVRGLPDEAGCVLIVGHNPGFEDLSAVLAVEGTPPPTLPTAGLAYLRFDVGRWRDIREGMGELVAVYTPKGLNRD